MFRSRFTVVVLTLALISLPVWAKKKKNANAAVEQPAAPQNIPQIDSSEKVLHALNRLAFGPRPGDVQSVERIGLSNWIEQQLHPDSIPENTVIDVKLQSMDTLRMTSLEIAEKYPNNQLIRQMVNGKLPWPSDPETASIAQWQAARFRERFDGQGGEGKKNAPSFDDAIARLPANEQDILRTGRPDQQEGLLESLPEHDQFEILSAMPQPQRQRIYEAASLQFRRRLQRFKGLQQVVNEDLAEAKIFRAVYSNRQLEEVLTDFWYNHFNVFLDKGADRYMVTAYERDAIRPFVLGKFQDLLIATAQNPAMLFYLDNFQSVKPDMESKVANGKKAKRGLNENYGRELMELHTLGVDGGYTQKDVTEVARCFTGWTIREPRRGGGFEFNPKQHDAGEKHVLGYTIPGGGGIEDGYKVIEILSHHPATARFISRSLATRFISDNPPATLVDRMAATFLKTDGDLREVMRTMIDSPEFWAQSVYRAKIKSPFEMVVSALRATDASLDFTTAVARQLNQLGEPLYRKVEPTGYSNAGGEWMNSAALLGRMNFALNLAANHVSGVKVSVPQTADVDQMARDLLGTELTADSRRIVESALNGQPTVQPAAMGQAAPTVKGPQKSPAALLAGLTLGSPDFQRR